MKDLTEPVSVNGGTWFPKEYSMADIYEFALMNREFGSGDREHKTPAESGESDHKPLPSVEATPSERDNETPREGQASDTSSGRAGGRAQPRALDPTVSTRAMQQATRDAILHRLQRGTRRDKGSA
jgi:hypothetical protein